MEEGERQETGIRMGWRWEEDKGPAKVTGGVSNGDERSV